MKRKKDDHGNIIKETSLNHLIRQCDVFFHEKTLLQYYGEELGSIMDHSPKCTADIAGDELEFDERWKNYGTNSLGYKRRKMMRSKSWQKKL